MPAARERRVARDSEEHRRALRLGLTFRRLMPGYECQDINYFTVLLDNRNGRRLSGTDKSVNRN